MEVLKINFENWNFGKLFKNWSFENWNFEELFENENFKIRIMENYLRMEFLKDKIFNIKRWIKRMTRGMKVVLEGGHAWPPKGKAWEHI